MDAPGYLTRPPGLLPWTGFVVGALVALESLDLTVYGIVIRVAAAALYLAIGRRAAPPCSARSIGVTYR